MNHVYESILNMVNFYDNEISRIEAKQIFLLRELRVNLQKDTGLENPNTDITYSGWDCPESIIGKCVYDEDEDPGHDCCIYCNEPSERK